ncbi:MAG: eight-cysteine-cluster domain-containing protein [Candidatus Anstonellales archaeon]
MDTKKFLAFAGLALVVTALLYFFAPRDKGIYLDAIIKSMEQESLARPVSISGYENSTSMERAYQINYDGANAMVKAIYAFYTKSLYVMNGTEYVCLSYQGSYACDKQTSNDLKSIIVTKDQAERIAKEMKFLWANKALSIKGIEETSECTKIEYVIDYTKLTTAQLREIGLSPTDSVVYIGSFRHVLCYSKDYKPVYRELYYALNGNQYSYKRGYKFEEGSTVFSPAADAQKYAEVKASINNVLVQLEKCLSSPSAIQCIEGVAYHEDNEQICGILEDQERCKLRILVGKGKPSLCEGLSALKDDCYGQYALQLGNTSLCEKISSAQKKQECISMISSRCYSDSDCAIGGCSGELCGLKGEEMVSTCIYKPEYDCLKYSSCTCISGKCQWKRTGEYLDCLSSLGKAEAEG